MYTLGQFQLDYDAVQWHHMVMQYHGQTGHIPDITFYCDGQAIASNPASGDPSYTFTNTDFTTPADSVTIGSAYLSGLYGFDGDIAAVRVYSRLLTPREILYNYNFGIRSDDNILSDINNDGVIDFLDFSQVANSWSTQPQDLGWYAKADLNADWLIGIDDIAAMCSQWLNPNSGNTFKDGPFKVLFSNDSTNMPGLDSWFHVPGSTAKILINGAVDETTGVGIDAHMLQPSLTWAPFWKSRYLPTKEHYDWYRRTYKIGRASCRERV